MKASVSALLMLSLLAAPAIARNNGTAASRRVDAETCRYYGFPAHTRAFSACLMNVRHYWSSGPCADPEFAAVHLRYCNVIPEVDF